MDLLLDHMDFWDETESKSQHAASRAYVRDRKAMSNTRMKVQVEDNTLVVCGEKKRDKDRDQKDGVKYTRMERRFGKFLNNFELPDNANTDDITASYQDAVLTVIIHKKPPPEPKQPKTIQVQCASN